MGRDWKWGSGSGSGSNTNRSRTTTTTRSSKKARSHGIQSTSHAAGSGCINAVFQLFDFHHFQTSSCNLWQQTVVPSFKHLPDEDQLEPSTTLKGAEAPRNSLEMDSPMPMESDSLFDSSPPIVISPEPPVINMRIRVPIRTTEDLSSECSSCSPGTITPNLVARLMGLDLLPQSSPRSSSSSSSNYSSATNSSLKSRHFHLNTTLVLKDSKTAPPPTQVRPSHAKFILDTDFFGSRSLPETPRISSERRSDVDFHRLSLQSNVRENSGGPMEEVLIESSRKSTGRRDLRVLEEDQEENRSPGFYARQIVKQVKDNISRKVGSDITNTVTVRNNRQSDHKQRDHGGGDDQIVLLKSKKPESRSSTGDQDYTSTNCSPRLKFLELKNRGANSQLSKSSTQTHETMSDVGTTSKHHQSSSAPKEEKKQSSDQKYCREMGKEIRRDQRLCLTSQNKSQPSDPIKNKKEETFFRSKLGRKKEKPPDKKTCMKTPLSSELFTSNNVTNLFHLKKDPPSPLTKLPQKQEYYNDARSSERSVIVRRDGSGPRLIFYSGNVGNRSLDLHDYVRSITTAGSVNVTVDPAVFHRLEVEASSLKLSYGSASVAINMSLRCNRLLIFDLVNEFLGMDEMLEKGTDLAETICGKIKNFEAVDCRVLEDIDSIIERDLRKGGERRMRIVEDEEEQKGIAEEIQRHLVDKLLEETTSLFWYNRK